MENEIKIFEHSDFGSVRTLRVGDLPWFVGKDVAEILGYNNTRDALARHVELEDKTTVVIPDSGSNYKSKTIIINESGLYSLILSSKLPASKKFKRWVTSEVIPSIRKHGGYLTPDKVKEALLNPDVLIELATNLKQEQEKNSELTATNAALTMEINTWDDRAIINALVRTFANRRCGNNFAVAWNILYKRMRYGEKICPRKRKIHKKNGSLLDTLTEDEIKLALKQATALCEEAGLDTGAIINEVNRKKVAAKA